MKKWIKRIASTVLAVTMVVGMTTTAFASEVTPAATSLPENCSGKKISFSDLPESYQEVIDPNAIIYQQDDGSYDIYQNSPILPPAETRAAQRYAPKGGSYSDIKNGWITSLTCVVYQTYLPRNKVDIWIANKVPNIKDYIIGQISSSTTGAIVSYISKTWGYGFLASAVVEIGNGAVFLLDWLNFNQVKTASNSGQNGILIEYLTNIGSGNSRVYSPWTSSYVTTQPYGGSATWHDGDYYVMP